MTRDDKLLARMRANPRGDWRMEDAIRLAQGFGLRVRTPSGGSHYSFKSPITGDTVIVPYHRPIKVVYVKDLIDLIDKHRKAGGGADA